MLSVYKPDTKAPIGRIRKAKAQTPSTVYLCSCCIARMCSKEPSIYLRRSSLMHLLRPSPVDKSLCGSYHTAYLSPVAGHTICINLIRLIIRCFLVNLSCAKPGLRSPSRQWQMRSIFRKCNNGIPKNRPGAHDVSPRPVCVSRRQYYLTHFQPKVCQQEPPLLTTQAPLQGSCQHS